MSEGMHAIRAPNVSRGDSFSSQVLHVVLQLLPSLRRKSLQQKENWCHMTLSLGLKGRCRSRILTCLTLSVMEFVMDYSGLEISLKQGFPGVDKKKPFYRSLRHIASKTERQAPRLHGHWISSKLIAIAEGRKDAPHFVVQVFS